MNTIGKVGAVVLAFAVCAALAMGCAKDPASSTGPAGPGGAAGRAGRNPPGMPGGMGGNADQWQRMREQNKYTFELARLVWSIGRLEKEGQAKLTPEQAQKLLPFCQELQKKEKLTQDNCKSYIVKIKPLLTPAQLAEIRKMEPERGPWRQPQGGGAGGAGGFGGRESAGGAGRPGGPAAGGPGSGQQRRGDPDQMKNMNPFNTERSKERFEELVKALEEKAKAQ